jgi:hypothetical protein
MPPPRGAGCGAAGLWLGVSAGAGTLHVVWGTLPTTGWPVSSVEARGPHSLISPKLPESQMPVFNVPAFQWMPLDWTSSTFFETDPAPQRASANLTAARGTRVLRELRQVPGGLPVAERTVQERVTAAVPVAARRDSGRRQATARGVHFGPRCALFVS